MPPVEHRPVRSSAARSVSLAALLILMGCANPGETIRLISSNSATVALEYTHSYSFELGETIKVAERECSRYGRHAEMVSNNRVSMDRSVATFRCVS